MDHPATTFTLLGGRLKLADTPPRPTEDPLWLAAAVPLLPPGSRVLDAGCGSGALGLAFGVFQPGHTLSFLDISPEATALTRTNLGLNGRSAEVLTGPLAAHQPATPYDAVLSNPPFHLTTRGHATPNPGKARAHGTTPEDLHMWLRQCLALTAAHGQVHVITHTATLPLLAPLWQGLRCGVTPLAGSAERPPKRAILSLMKSGPAGQVTTHPAINAHAAELRRKTLHEAIPLQTRAQTPKPPPSGS